MTSDSCEGKLKKAFHVQYVYKKNTSHIVLSIPVENPANSSNPVEIRPSF